MRDNININNVYTLWPIKNNHLNFSLFLCQICISVSQSCSSHSTDCICRGDVTSF